MGAGVQDGRQHSRDSPQSFRAGLYGLDEPDLARGLLGGGPPRGDFVMPRLDRGIHAVSEKHITRSG